MKEIRSSVNERELLRRSVRILGFGGVVPFWAVLFLQFAEPALGEDTVRMGERWVLLYALTICSFMGGGRWVFRLFDPDTHPRSIFGGFLSAVMPPLLAWVIAAWPDLLLGRELTPLVRLVLIGLLLVFQLVQDLTHRSVPPWYKEIRIMLTTGATTPIFVGAFLAPLF